MSVCEEVKKILAQPIGIKQSDGSVFITELSEDTIETRSGQIWIPNLVVLIFMSGRGRW